MQPELLGIFVALGLSNTMALVHDHVIIH